MTPRKVPRSTRDDDLLTAPQLAAMIRRPVQSVYDMRHRGTGPRGMRPNGGKLLFRRSDVDVWLEQHADAEAD